MKTLIIRAIGKAHEPWHQQAIHMYAERIRPLGQLRIEELAEGHQRSAKPDIQKTLKKEGETILKGIPKEVFVIALDSKGKNMDSPAFANKIEEWSEGGREIVFVIGGSWGLDEAVMKRANATISFGAMTFPHMMARVMLMEQVYRGLSILAGKAYHK